MKENLFKTGAKWLNDRSRRLKVRQWTVGLALFCMLGVGMSAYLVRGALVPGMKYLVRIQPISVPAFFDAAEEHEPPLEKVRTWADSVRRYYIPRPDSNSKPAGKVNQKQSNLKNHGNIR